MTQTHPAGADTFVVRHGHRPAARLCQASAVYTQDLLSIEKNFWDREFLQTGSHRRDARSNVVAEMLSLSHAVAGRCSRAPERSIRVQHDLLRSGGCVWYALPWVPASRWRGHDRFRLLRDEISSSDGSRTRGGSGMLKSAQRSKRERPACSVDRNISGTDHFVEHSNSSSLVQSMDLFSVLCLYASTP
jgi:hypothetical protein